MDLQTLEEKLLTAGLDEAETDAYHTALERRGAPLLFNGIDAATGEPLSPPLTAAELKARLDRRPPEEPDVRAELCRKTAKQFPIRAGNDPQDLAQAGWAVIFPQTLDPTEQARFAAIREALEPLLELRAAQAGERFKVFEGGEGVLPRDTARKFLERHGVAAGPADPAELPYYGGRRSST